MKKNLLKNIYKCFYLKRIKRGFRSCGIDFRIGKYSSIINPQFITIGNQFYAGRGLSLQAWEKYRGVISSFVPNIEIGDRVSMMNNCLISCANSILIGNGVLLGDNVLITDNYHGRIERDELDIPPIERRLSVGNEIVIGDNVWIGRNVCIMPGVTIGKGSIIGANAVVTQNVPAYCVAVGVPARIIKRL